MPDRKINVCSKFAVRLKLFLATVANADIGSLIRMVQTIRNFELFDEKPGFLNHF